MAAGLDLVLGEPPDRWHPVVLGASLIRAGHERARAGSPTAQVAAGGAATAMAAMAAAALGRVAERGAEAIPVPALEPLALGAALKPSFALRALLAEASAVAGRLEADDLPGARHRLRALVSRPTAELTEGLVASAACESLAENLTDSVVAPWLAFLLLGLPGAAAYRMVNTADAMYGYRGELEWLGRAAAVADDWANWLPSRLAAVLLVGAAGLVSGPSAAAGAWRGWREDAGRTASPNAGQTMSAMAGALGRRLEKRDAYVLGSGRPAPGPDDIRRAIRLVSAAAGLMGAAAMLLAACPPGGVDAPTSGRQRR